MRRLVLTLALAASGLGASALPVAAQSPYPPSPAYEPYEREPFLPPRAGREPADRVIQSQPLPPVGERGAPHPYDIRARQQAAPAETVPSPQHRDYEFGARSPAYGAMPPYNEPVRPGRGYPPAGEPMEAYGPGGPSSSAATPADDPRLAPPRPPLAIEPGRSPAATGYPAPAQPGVYAALPPEDQPEIGEPKELPPQFKRQVVDYRTREPAGTIVIDTPSTFLYYVNGDGTAIRYGIGVGREGFTWSGTERITRMAEWPDWHPPAEMIERQPYLPRFMAGGESNPLGARALYLGRTIYRVHGTNQPSTIGQFVSSGCIRMLNEDVQDLYSRVKIGTKVVVLGDGKGNAASNTSARR